MAKMATKKSAKPKSRVGKSRSPSSKSTTRRATKGRAAKKQPKMPAAKSAAKSAKNPLGVGSKKTPPKEPAGKATTTTKFKKAPVTLPPPKSTPGNLGKTEPNVTSISARMPKVGDIAPDFELPDAQGEPVRLSDLRGSKVVVYFYPKDDTPGCTIEARGFTEDSEAFEERGVMVLGISKDDVRSHAAFTTKCGLKVRLLADPSTKTIQDYGCWVEKSNYGKTYLGTQRATFLIDERGRVMKVWPKVTPEGHSKEILAVIG